MPPWQFISTTSSVIIELYLVVLDLCERLENNDFKGAENLVKSIINYSEIDFIFIVDNCSTDNSFDDITTPSDDGSDATDNPNDGSEFTGFSNLCQTYKVSKQALGDLGRYLWNQSIFSDIKLLNNSLYLICSSRCICSR